MIFAYILYGAVGKLLMFFVRKFPPANILAKRIHFPIDCDLCLGFWVYFVLSFAFGFDILYPEPYAPLISEIVTGAGMSLIVHLISIGWRSEFSVMVVQ